MTERLCLEYPTATFRLVGLGGEVYTIWRYEQTLEQAEEWLRRERAAHATLHFVLERKRDGDI